MRLIGAIAAFAVSPLVDSDSSPSSFFRGSPSSLSDVEGQTSKEGSQPRRLISPFVPPPRPNETFKVEGGSLYFNPSFREGFAYEPFDPSSLNGKLGLSETAVGGSSLLPSFDQEAQVLELLRSGAVMAPRQPYMLQVPLDSSVSQVPDFFPEVWRRQKEWRDKHNAEQIQRLKTIRETGRSVTEPGIVKPPEMPSVDALFPEIPLRVRMPEAGGEEEAEVAAEIAGLPADQRKPTGVTGRDEEREYFSDSPKDDGVFDSPFTSRNSASSFRSRSSSSSFGSAFGFGDGRNVRGGGFGFG
uniref:Uncharacterized protein n=1 Tax=Chromera velia CCMP2878 TaxID=1169474 RepID=A0A0G4F5Q2_9ALVE|eukprot:Cvel_15253.t1-p1 / transcript=Cvel_15253.t1 / gene=Cvel_15253 / organism=Chromera_velia_CCMP2878 / gene_product=hypothetical protein / transcript_product=hypothetical protein / location=Cvel_scaffold1117:47133-49315(-) / protein_length=299 / sequence_SO=supercontig / SO=protein_coding / is_pseudo=false